MMLISSKERLKNFFRKVLTNRKRHDIIRTSNKSNGGYIPWKKYLRRFLRESKQTQR